MSFLKASALPVFGAVLFGAIALWAQNPKHEGIGRAPAAEEIRAIDIAIGLDGKELPPGSGDAKAGAPIYAAKCQGCHGANLEGARLGPALAGGKGTLTTIAPVRSIGTYWPFATTLWDYINRAMPRNREGTLTADEVYALTAFLLAKNGVIQESEAMDAKSLPKVRMPNRPNFIPERLEDIPDVKKRGCRLGICP